MILRRLNGGCIAMKNLKIIVLILFLLNLTLSCGDVNSQVKKDKTDKTVEKFPNKEPIVDIISKLKEEKIKTYGEWDVGEDSPLVYLVKNDDNQDVFSIVNSSGKILYENKVVEIGNVYQVWALRTGEPQLVFQYNEGGQDSFVEMLNYNQGNISEIIDPTNGANSFGSGISIQPQFRSSVNPAKEPFEILLGELGLPSSAGKFTKILRYKDKKYRYFGEFDREKLGDYKEQFIIR